MTLNDFCRSDTILILLFYSMVIFIKTLGIVMYKIYSPRIDFVVTAAAD